MLQPDYFKTFSLNTDLVRLRGYSGASYVGSFFKGEDGKWRDAATAKQPTPHGTGAPILGMVLADLTNRALEGKEKYGEALKANNGRSALVDAYQEALDLAMYLRQAIEEAKHD